ncbi:ROK family protein [Streptomyces sp. NBC_00932]|uniref:ROK family protein n=1 Tax=Streptomyces sp. NBC_00932 TaxID=2903690 RepID=UPI00386AD495|nr:ROK family transcriptional regulator [Streptomyces sp. NBC_00932]
MARTSGDPSILRQLNSAAALRALMEAPGALTVAQLGSVIGVTRPPAERIVNELIAGSWAEEEPPTAARQVGRPARRYRFRADAGHVIGIDIGAHKTLAAAADLRGDVRAERRAALDPEMGAAARLAAARDNALACLQSAGLAPDGLLAAGIGTSGVIDERGQVALCSILPEWTGLDLTATAGEFLPGVPVLVENDVRLGALAEHWRGAAQGAEDVILLHAGRRLSAGLLLGGRPRRGSHGAAGEIGHLSYLNWMHSFERFADYREGEHGPAAGAEPAARVFAALRDGDRQAGYLVDAFARELADGLAAMVLAVDPEIVVIGGGLSRAGELLAGPVRRHLAAHCLFPPEVAVSGLGDEAVALGAVRLAADGVKERLLTGPLRPAPALG